MYFNVIYLLGCKYVIVLNVEVLVVHSKDGVYLNTLNIAILHQIAPLTTISLLRSDLR
jgi:hypothetical protein